MSMTALEQNTVTKAIMASKQAIDSMKPQLDYLNTIYNAEGGVKDTLTDQELAEVPSFSGLTKQEVDDGVYALTKIMTEIGASYQQLAQLAARA